MSAILCLCCGLFQLLNACTAEHLCCCCWSTDSDSEDEQEEEEGEGEEYGDVQDHQPEVSLVALSHPKWKLPLNLFCLLNAILHLQMWAWQAWSHTKLLVLLMLIVMI